MMQHKERVCVTDLQASHLTTLPAVLQTSCWYVFSSSLLFHAGQAAIKLPSAEASKWAQCTGQDNIHLT